MRRLLKAVVLFTIGGAVYFSLELLFRGYSHWTMAALGGFCFLLIGGINEFLPWKMGIFYQALIGGAGVTLAELFAGLILNVHFKMGIWDYSNQPLNFAGQICLKFSALWVLVSLFGIVLDDFLRYWIFKEEKPHYTFF